MKVFGASSFLMHSALALAGPNRPDIDEIAGGIGLPGIDRILKDEVRILKNPGGSDTDNWGGVIINQGPYSSAGGRFKVPTPKIPPGGNSSVTYCGSAWVGIDGTCDVILQAGVAFCVKGDVPWAYAWTEWYPQTAIPIEEFDVLIGDEIEVVLNVTGKNSGRAFVKNWSDKQAHVEVFSDKKEICNDRAEWIVEDFEQNGIVPFADFDSVKFTNAFAIHNGKRVDTTNAEISNINQDNKAVTVARHSGSNVEVDYVLIF